MPRSRLSDKVVLDARKDQLTDADRKTLQQAIDGENPSIAGSLAGAGTGIHAVNPAGRQVLVVGGDKLVAFRQPATPLARSQRQRRSFLQLESRPGVRSGTMYSWSWSARAPGDSG